MRSSSKDNRDGVRQTARWLVMAGALCLGQCGCASTWDDIRSDERSWGMFWTKQDPLVVLRDSTDGSKRAWALSQLQEPLQHGGNQKDQEFYIGLLKTSATSDQESLCRLAAVRSLGHFKDPRAADILETVYLQNLNFGQEINGLVRQQCLESMADIGGPIALRRLVLVAKEPPANGNEGERQETLDRRLAAVRGLGKFKDAEAAATLAFVLKSERDIAMRDRAHESLQICTGKHLPPDSPQWAVYIPQASTPTQPEVQRVGGVQNAAVPVSLPAATPPQQR